MRMQRRVFRSTPGFGPNSAVTYNYRVTGGWLESKHERSRELTSGVERTRREIIQADITRRIRRVCGHLSEEEFSELVNNMTDRQIRSEHRSQVF